MLSALAVLSPAPAAPAQGRAESVYPKMMWHEKHQGVWGFNMSSPALDMQGEHVQGVFLSVHTRTEGQPHPLHA